MSEDMPMVDFVLYAMHEAGEKAGTEIKGSAVKLMRFPEKLSERMYGRFSGPWQDLRLGLHNKYQKRRVQGAKNKATRLVLEPCEEQTFRRGDKEVTYNASVDIETYGIRVKDTSGTLNRASDESFPRFSADNEEYLRKKCLHHFQHGTLKDLEDETGDAVYVEELPKLKALIGKAVYWEFRPYIRTARGAASGVDDYRLEIVKDMKDAPLPVVESKSE